MKPSSDARGLKEAPDTKRFSRGEIQQRLGISVADDPVAVQLQAMTAVSAGSLKSK
jgi:hypothetical protein